MKTVCLGPRATLLSTVDTNEIETHLELNSHADTSCLGKGALVCKEYMTPINVQGYDPALGNRSYRTISGAVSYYHPLSGQIYHIVIHQAIDTPGLKHDLLCPMQVWTNGVTVNDCFKYLSDQPTDETRIIVCADEWEEKVVLPLILNGVTSCLPFRILIGS